MTAGEGKRVAVLLHGFPQTWWARRHVIPKLADAGFRVVAPDHRGAGHSSHPASGYDKRTMAQDTYRAALKASGKLTVPVLAIGGEISTLGPVMAGMMREVADNARSVRVPGTAHFIAEENPAAMGSELLGFLAPDVTTG